MRVFAALGMALAGAAIPLSAHAESSLPGPFSGDQLRGTLDVRTGLADGERSWLREGLGKGRFSGDGRAADAQVFARGILVWRPHLSWNVDAHITLEADTQLHPVADVMEAFLSYRGAPSAGWRVSGRAGLFYPPVSLENTGIGWTSVETITPSAINSWIGEEVKTAGVEATARRMFGQQQFAATLGLFGANDTAGTLLAVRGWALGDVFSGVQTELPLPPYAYQEFTRSTAELDGRAGYYTRLEYRPMGFMTFDVMHYDNKSDGRSDARHLTDWRTQFTDVGLRAMLDAHTRLLAQAMAGATEWGRHTPMGYWSDLDFAAAYVLLAHDVGAGSVAGRVDWFETSENNPVAADDRDEDGWAITAAWQRPLSPALRFVLEAMHVESQRPGRADQGLNPAQRQTTLQSALRASF